VWNFIAPAIKSSPLEAALATPTGLHPFI